MTVRWRSSSAGRQGAFHQGEVTVVQCGDGLEEHGAPPGAVTDVGDAASENGGAHRQTSLRRMLRVAPVAGRPQMSILNTMPASVKDEGLHPAGDDADWQESVYLAWRDHRAGFGGNHRIGNEVNRGTANLWCGVYHDAGTRFRHNGEDLVLEHPDEHGLSAGPHRLFHDGERLRFVLQGDGCVVDLEIDDDPDSFVEANAETFSGSRGSAGAIFSNNFHTFCMVRGTVTLDGRTEEVQGPGWRDHSWGVRRWESFLSSRSFGGTFGPSSHFRYGSMVGANGSFFRQGSLTRHGEPVAVAGTEMLVTVDDDSLRCPS